MAIPAAANKSIPIQAPAANNSIPIQPPIKRRPGRPRGTGKKPQPATDGVTPMKRRPGRPPGIKQKQPPTEAILQPTEAVLASQQMLVTKPPAKRRKSAPLKRMELSVTLSVVGADISPGVFPLLQNFLQSRCETGVFAVERGGSMLNLHVQGVIAMLCSSAVDAKKQLTAAVGWADERHMLTADALGDMVDSDHNSPHPERVSGNAAAHEVTEFASFIPLVPGLEADQFDSSDVPLEGVASNCIFCN
ncbi:hypothetical protein R1sor_021761 [Riccia sorocarpa]|uniref:Uncharacterized protein n=1 Tax=Riccia sorocarpa TaxID=122646 RepID=A0ABD3GL88_9MARC